VPRTLACEYITSFCDICSSEINRLRDETNCEDNDKTRHRLREFYQDAGVMASVSFHLILVYDALIGVTATYQTLEPLQF